MKRFGCVGLLTVLLMGLPAVAQKAGRGGITQASVRAHEEFLASDAMRGRGSATHDEEVAATYVATEFMSYGLKPAPGMTGYIQAADIVSSTLDGHATLVSGKVDLSEGADFQVLSSSGLSASGTLKRVTMNEAGKAANVSGTIVLLTAVTDPRPMMRTAQALGKAGAVAVLVAESPATDAVFTSGGGKTRTTIALADGQPSRARGTIVTLEGAALAQLEAVPDGSRVSLNVHGVDRAEQRKTFNAVGWLPGTDAGAGTVLLTAHLDHLGVGHPVHGDAIWNGANDDAAGTTAVLELAQALAAGPRLRRSVLFVCYGSEEAGELGSTYFGEHPPVPLTSLVANLEFEMIGNQDPKMAQGVLLLTGWERSNLGPALKTHGARLGPDPYPEEHFFERSDNYALALKGVVAHTAAGWGTPPTYHQPDDDLAHLDVPFMTAAIQSLVEPVRWLASSMFVPKWNSEGQPQPGH